MRTRPIAILCMLVSAATSRAWNQSENSWEKYKPRTLKSIIDAHQPGLEQLDSSHGQVFVSTDSFPSQVKLVYLAKSRSLSASKKELLGGWAKTVGEHRPVLDVFGTESLFKEGVEEHWI